MFGEFAQQAKQAKNTERKLFFCRNLRKLIFDEIDQFANWRKRTECQKLANIFSEIGKLEKGN